MSVKQDYLEAYKLLEKIANRVTGLTIPEWTEWNNIKRNHIQKYVKSRCVIRITNGSKVTYVCNRCGSNEDINNARIFKSVQGAKSSNAWRYQRKGNGSETVEIIKIELKPL